MQFRTELRADDLPEGICRLSHRGGPIVLLGSCFADNIAERLRADLFNVVSNPFGTLYNPVSILRHLLPRPYIPGDIVRAPDGLYYSWDHSSAFSAATRQELLERINREDRDFRETLKQAQALFVTYGTAMVWTVPSEAGRTVANCHKMHPLMFRTQMLSVDETADIVRRTIDAVAPVPVIFTVSPVRYISPSLHDSQLAKATLLLALDKAGANYFPAYEALTDDLRDYRFYGDDLVHPSKMAVDYIYELFGKTFFDPADAECLNLCRRYVRLAAHRPIVEALAGEHAARVSQLKQTLAHKYGIKP